MKSPTLPWLSRAARREQEKQLLELARQARTGAIRGFLFAAVGDDPRQEHYTKITFVSSNLPSAKDYAALSHAVAEAVALMDGLYASKKKWEESMDNKKIIPGGEVRKD